MLKSVRHCHAADAAMPDKFIQIREGAMVRNGLMVSVFTLIFAVSASLRTACGAVVSASWVNSNATTSMNSSAAASRCRKGEITRC